MIHNLRNRVSLSPLLPAFPHLYIAVFEASQCIGEEVNFVKWAVLLLFQCTYHVTQKGQLQYPSIANIKG